MLIGREKERETLLRLLDSEQSEFVAVYGRRRVGKTYLVREAFNYQFAFQHTGLLDAPLKEQLAEFRESLYAAGMGKCAMPHTWSEAFRLLQRHLTAAPEGKKVIFIDELPWMDTPRSNFIRALDHFWNAWATTRKDIVLIVCGSATSWIIENIVMNYGGLHNRLTRQIHLQPFNLHECELYCKHQKLGYTRRQILEAFMVMGGVPYYWSFMQKGLSLAQNIDHLFFAENGELTHEYDALYASLFRNPKLHLAIINTLATKKVGMSREELVKNANLVDSGSFSTALKELEQCSFIRRYTYIGKKNRDALYQLMDNYTLFYFKFIQQNVNGDKHFWTSQLSTPIHDTWAGLAFERVCLQHLEQIKKALGFSAVISTAHSWTHKPKDENDKGVQIDLLIDRNDDVINLCEMKYSKDEYQIDGDEDQWLRRRVSTFQRETGTKKAIHLTMITTYGIQPGGYADDIQSQVTMDDLFVE